MSAIDKIEIYKNGHMIWSDTRVKSNGYASGVLLALLIYIHLHKVLEKYDSTADFLIKATVNGRDFSVTSISETGIKIIKDETKGYMEAVPPMGKYAVWIASTESVQQRNSILVEIETNDFIPGIIRIVKDLHIDLAYVMDSYPIDHNKQQYNIF